MNRLESQSSSVGERFKSIVHLTSAAIFGFLGYEIVADAGGSFAEKALGVIAGAFIGNEVGKGITKTA